ncbi:hypothetical protein AB1278_06275 [Chryseobacterium sp. NRRL B-14798]|uniref:hypothetical protein n=1 Tax=Chryseobacterium sp. NRRL B-14798 TaxID=3162880 RepID=UPI003D1C3464
MKNKYFYGFLITFIYTGYNAQVSDTVKKLAQPLSTLSYAESSHIGYGGEESKIYNQFKKIAKTASNDELYYYAMNGSNALRVYSAKELFKRNDKRFLVIYTFYYNNPLMMKYTLGCVGENKNISEFLKDEVYSAQDYISLRDHLLKNKDKQDEMSKLQLSQIRDHGYGKLTEENVNSVKKHLEEIDNKKSN